MLKLIDAHFRKKHIKRYEQEAAHVEKIANQMQGMPQGTLATNFNNLYGRDDRESMRIGFAIIVEMAERTLGLRPYRVQIMGALAMSDGHIAEMATGEGKTLTAALPLAWHGLQDRAHAMTVNDYLAERDARFLGPLFEAIGLSVNYLQGHMGHEARQLAYQSNIVYGTPSQFVFDYLRDHVAYSRESLLQQGHHFALVDEADSIFIDEARTPMVLSGEGELDQSLWVDLYRLIDSLSFQECAKDKRTQLEKMVLDPDQVDADIAINTAEHQASLTEAGIEKVETFLLQNGYIADSKELWQTGKSHLWRMIGACTKACHLFKINRDYIVRDDKAVIIDQETGRLSPGKRWNDGLHQAIEAKEGLTIRPESKDLGRIALSNYLSLYTRVSGMTGTAMTEAQEISELYGLDVIPIPTHRERIREDLPDLVFMTQKGKWRQIVEDVKVIHANGQPVLIGTGSVDDSERLSTLFSQEGIIHRVLNARQDAAEALIVAQAGRLGSVTIATSMAGRGTDIMLGGNREIIAGHDEETLREFGITLPADDEREKVIAAGGLFVIGCERLDSPRLDLQLAGRSGRQGDPGKTRFYVALDDPLMKNFGGESLSALFMKLGIGELDGLEHPMITRAIVKAQQRKQSLYVESRRQGLKQDTVIDKPRKVFFKIRNDLLHAENDDIPEILRVQVSLSIQQMAGVYLNNGAGFDEEWDSESFAGKFTQWGLSATWYKSIYEEFSSRTIKIDGFIDKLVEWTKFDIISRLGQFCEDRNSIVKQCLLMAVDRQWQIFLDESEHIRNGIHLRAYAQEKPDLAFQKEIFKLFTALIDDLPVVMLDYVYALIADREKMIDLQDSQVEIFNGIGEEENPQNTDA